MTINQIFFAVKTWTNNHEDRVPVIQRTWAKDTKHIRYYSDVAGNSYHLTIHIIIIGPKAWHFFCSPSSAESKHEKSVTSTNYLIQKCSILFYSKRKNTHRSSNTDHKYKYREHRAWALCQNPSHIAKSLGGNTSEWAIETNQICSFMWWRHSI